MDNIIIGKSSAYNERKGNKKKSAFTHNYSGQYDGLVLVLLFNNVQSSHQIGDGNSPTQPAGGKHLALRSWVENCIDLFVKPKKLVGSIKTLYFLTEDTSKKPNAGMP